MFSLKKIDQKSWMLMDNNNNSSYGILTKNINNGIYSLTEKYDTGISHQRFLNEQAVINYFMPSVKGNIFEKIEPLTYKPAEHWIEGYPISFKTPILVASTTTKLPLFSKNIKSKVYHCAGYYCVNFPRGWIHSFCPKLETLKKYKYIGPFKTKEEMKTELARIRNEEPK